MTQVELAGKIGNDLLNIVKVYLKGQLTMDELSMILGRDRTEEVKKYMKGARALIFPSLWYEGAPLTPLEAMSFAIPCAISKDCAGNEYITNENGVLIDCSDLEQVKKQILYLDKNVKKMGNNSLNYFYSYSKVDYVGKLKEFYEEMI